MTKVEVNNWKKQVVRGLDMKIGSYGMVCNQDKIVIRISTSLICLETGNNVPLNTLVEPFPDNIKLSLSIN